MTRASAEVSTNSPEISEESALSNEVLQGAPNYIRRGESRRNAESTSATLDQVEPLTSMFGRRRPVSDQRLHLMRVEAESRHAIPLIGFDSGARTDYVSVPHTKHFLQRVQRSHS